MTFSRRHLMMTSLVALLAPALAATRARAAEAREIMWEDLIPENVPYSEIIGQGEIDYAADTWNPVYDENATKLNSDLNGEKIKMPGYILPLEMDENGVREFVLVPYVGACVHTPPPPANQLVFVTTEVPWPSDQLWDAVWVTGTMKADIQDKDIATIGYALTAEFIELYEW